MCLMGFQSAVSLGSSHPKLFPELEHILGSVPLWSETSILQHVGLQHRAAHDLLENLVGPENNLLMERYRNIEK